MFTQEFRKTIFIDTCNLVWLLWSCSHIVELFLSSFNEILREKTCYCILLLKQLSEILPLYLKSTFRRFKTLNTFKSTSRSSIQSWCHFMHSYFFFIIIVIDIVLSSNTKLLLNMMVKVFHTLKVKSSLSIVSFVIYVVVSQKIPWNINFWITTSIYTWL